jgi:Glycosyl transferase family 2
MPPLVTVLMAVHNGEPFVRQSLQSVLAQTYNEFELLVIDDASTDTTPEIVRRLGDNRVRLIRNERNLGQVPSLNRGLREAQGEYVARLDADDICLSERLARQVAVLESNPAVCLVGSWIQAVDERGRELGRLQRTLTDYVDFLYHTLIMRVYISHPASMYRRAPVLALGGYDETKGPAEDKDLWRKLALERHDARIVPEILLRYRVHDEQLSKTQASYQQWIDAESQDHFLAQLAPSVLVTPARKLLAGAPEAWSDDPSEALRGIELILDGAHRRLRLAEPEAAWLEKRVLERLLEVSNLRPWHEYSGVVAAHALAKLPNEDRARALRSRALAHAVAPARWSARRAMRLLAGLEPVHTRVRRSPVARRLYGKAIGTE